MTAQSITRRDALVSAAGLAGSLAVLAPLGLAACAAGDETRPATATQTLAEEVVADELSLVADYDAVIAGHPELASTLKAIRDQHLEHARAIDASVAEPAAPSPTAVSSPTSATFALTGLRHAERRASHARIAACGKATEPALARLLALIAASESAHVPALREARP